MVMTVSTAVTGTICFMVVTVATVSMEVRAMTGCWAGRAMTGWKAGPVTTSSRAARGGIGSPAGQAMTGSRVGLATTGSPAARERTSSSSGRDEIDVSRLAGVNSLSDLTVWQAGKDTIIEHGSDILILKGVKESDLDNSDFIF
jgi:hypothetical protein